ncbi:hypothetical protein TraAM80_04803 [Trypanosoma rangeli]|uniref:Uncharacterized protein n=1 Tax=Trypanosoma rangeli TaxID=5698 RepID=A0A3R7KN04_TRYRA|nr:uncharacterized protein TraAM80_04803 [Trypanosoma rangeli]RNF04950.1 hypothetical protein TraAM80_04803 [Trypanosoma rangeli]|eukprot:RNF04950.1 hypothetical protein TraAM80_04803 [Trypanosoma rangeli]
MTRKDSVAQKPTASTPLPLYNTAVRSSLDPRPVLLRVPLLTPSCHEAEDGNSDNDASFLHAAELQSGHVVAVDRSSSRKARRSADGCEGTNLKFDSANLSLMMSPTPQPLWPHASEVSVTRVPDKHLAKAPSPPPAVSRRSTSAMLVSPRPSPLSKGGMNGERREGHVPPFAQVFPAASKVQERTGGKGDCAEVQRFLQVVPPHPQIRSPLQHLLVYNNEAQRQSEGSSVGNVGLVAQGSRAQSHSIAASASSLADEVQLRSSFIRGGDWRSQVDPCRTSPTSLQFSLPRDDKSSSSTDSTLTAQLPFSSTRRCLQGSRISPFSTRRVAFSLALVNEDGSTSGEDHRNGTKRSTPLPPLRSSSVPVCRTARVAGGLADNARPSSALHNSSTFSVRPSTAEPVHLPQPIIPAKTEIMKVYHALQIQEQALLLMEREEKERREITTAYVHAIRGLIVNYTFQRTLLLAGDEKTFSPNSCPWKETSTTLKRERTKRKAAVKEEGTTKTKAGLKVAGSPPQSSITKAAGSYSPKFSPHRSVALAEDKGARRDLVPACVHDRFHMQRCQGTEKELIATGSTSGRRPIVDPSSSSGVESLFLLEVGENMSCVDHAMRLVEGRLLRFFSAETSARQCVVEEEAHTFHFLLRYHRLCENALQPAVIYLQEACQWQNVLTEATNDLHRLQDARLDWELQQNIESARAYARNVAALMEQENHIRFVRIQQTEAQEYRQLVQVFYSGLTALAELWMCNQRRHVWELEERMKTIVFQEGEDREAVWITELRQRGVLYRRFENEYQIRASCAWDSSPPTRGNREDAAVDASIELSAIVGVHGDDHSCVSHVEGTSANSPAAVTMSNAKTPSTMQSVNSIGAQLMTVAAAEYDAAREATWSRSVKQAAQVEREFFEWNPTSNTLLTATNNTTTGTTTLVVGGDSHLVHNTSISGQGGPLAPSSPQPRSIPCSGTTLHSGLSSHRDALAAAEARDEDQTQHDETCCNAPAALCEGNVDASIEGLDVTPDSSGLNALVSSNSSCKALRRDVGVSVNLRSFETSRAAVKGHVARLNRHIVPCSLKDHRCCNEQRHEVSLLPQRQRSGGRSHMTSCGTQLTPPTRRPYRDDVIFVRDPQKPLSTATKKERIPAEATMGLRKEVSNRAVLRTSSSSSASPCQGEDAVRGEVSQEDGTELGGGEEGLEEVEVLEDIDDWSQASGEVEEGTTRRVEEAPLPVQSPSLHTPCIAYLTTAALETQEAQNDTLSTKHVRRECDTFPEYSLSTMLDTTAAVSVDPYEMDAHRMKQNCAIKVEEATSLSSPSSCTHSVSQSTGINRMSDKGVHNSKCMHDGERCEDISRSFFTEVEANVFTQARRDSVVFYYPPLNYMRPTMSWRRQHEGLEWPTKPSPSQGRSHSVRSNCSGQTGSQRRWKEGTPTHVTRVPLEEGPGVWGDAEIPRRPFGYDVSGNKAYEVTNTVCSQIPVVTTIASPIRRRDAACRFMAEGATTRSPSHSGRSVSCPRDDFSTAAKAKVEFMEKENQEFFDDPMTLANLHGIIQRRSVSPRQASVATNVETLFRTGRLRSMTPSYVDAFYKLDHEAAGRKRLLASLCRGSTLRELPRAAAETTPYRQHHQHHHRRSSDGNASGRGLKLSPGTSCGNFTRSPWSPKPKPWR